MRVFIDGPPIAGSCETLKRMGERSVPPVAHVYGGPPVLDFRADGKHVFQIRERVDKVRLYDLVADADAEPRYSEQRDYLATIDALIFVVDSQWERLAAGIQRFYEIRAALVRLGREREMPPVVFQLNKRDLPTAATEAELRQRFHAERCAYVATVATEGLGIDALLATLMQIVEQHSSRSQSRPGR